MHGFGLLMRRTDRKPQASVAQVGVEGLPRHARLHRHVKVLLVEVQNPIHVSQAEADATLRGRNGIVYS